MAANTSVLAALGMMVSCLGLLALLLATGRKSRVENRIEELTGRGNPLAGSENLAQLARATLPKMALPLLPKDEEERTRLEARLIHAGLYSRQALHLFLGVKMTLLVGPLVVCLAGAAIGLVDFSDALIGGGIGSGLGLVGPSFWLDWRKAARQTIFRRSLPDAMDVLVVCLEAGQSLTGALRRVAEELGRAHPLLAGELYIVVRESQLGRSEGEAMRHFADRTDLEEVRSLASVILQAEHFGAGLAKALRVHADTLRNNRLLRAEEQAQKAAIKILFPTALFIFPALFVVILGPAAIQVWEMLERAGL